LAKGHRVKIHQNGTSLQIEGIVVEVEVAVELGFVGSSVDERILRALVEILFLLRLMAIAKV
jgi:hypothetical protein